MKRILLLSVLSAVMVGCWTKTTPRSYVRPVKVEKVKPLRTYDKEFVGVVSAEQYTNYAFRVGGMIIKTYVTDGTFVKKGQLMAELDPSDFLLDLQANKAQYQTTKSILERNKRLLEKQAISQQDYEIAAANFQNAKSSYEYAQNQLEYTKLRAPFSGSVEKKFVENYQKINAGEPIYKIINPDVLEVKFTLPENEVGIGQTADFYIEFDNLRGELFTAKVKEVVDASVDGAGIPVTLAIVDKNFKPEKYNIKAGFACRVKIIVEPVKYNKTLCLVPVTAIFSKEDEPNSYYVWIYNSQTSDVVSRKVEYEGLLGNDNVIIKGGLQEGEDVVTAGVYQLVDNQKVNLLK